METTEERAFVVDRVSGKDNRSVTSACPCVRFYFSFWTNWPITLLFACLRVMTVVYDIVQHVGCSACSFLPSSCRVLEPAHPDTRRFHTQSRDRFFPQWLMSRPLLQMNCMLCLTMRKYNYVLSDVTNIHDNLLHSKSTAKSKKKCSGYCLNWSDTTWLNMISCRFRNTLQGGSKTRTTYKTCLATFRKLCDILD